MMIFHSQLVILSPPMGHNKSRLFPRGTQHWTLWHVRWWWCVRANWWYWVPLGHNESRLFLGGNQHWTIWCLLVTIFQGQLGDTEFPWGTMTIDFPGGTEHSAMTSPLVIIFHIQLVILVLLWHNKRRLVPGGTEHWTILCPLIMLFHGHLVILSSLGAQKQQALPQGHSTLTNVMSTGDICRANWWYWVLLGHNNSGLLHGGTQHWTWCPLGIIFRGHLMILNSPRPQWQ